MTEHAHPTPPAWQAAASFAAWKHRHQMRKDQRTPYIAHPFRVAMTVLTVFDCRDDLAICAALLHDTIEDTLTDYDELADRFGEPVADIVASLTKNMALPDHKREADYDARLMQADWRAKLIKLADVHDNWWDLPDRTEAGLADIRDKIRRSLVIADADAAAPAELAAAATIVRRLLIAHP